MNATTFSAFGAKSWREGQRLEPHTHDAWSYWSAATPRQGDTEARLQMRLAKCDALHLAPRDPRFYKPEREAQWQNTSPLWQRYIPEYGITEDMSCIGQAEEHVRRPTLANPNRLSPDFVTSRTKAGRRTTPLISYNSIGWNRRHYEPLPDASRPHTSTSPYEGRKQTDWSRGRSRKPFAAGPPMGLTGTVPPSAETSIASRLSSLPPAFQEGYYSARGLDDADSEYEPPRISGVDTSSRPPLVVHNKTRVYRPPWIGIEY